MALNVDILSVNSLFINGVDILSNKRDYVELVGDEKIVIDVPSTTYTKAIPQIGVNLGDVELKTTPLDGKTFDTINNAGGVSVDGVSHTVDSVGCYVSNINIDSFVINKTSVVKSLDYTTYKWHDVDYGKYDLALSCDSLSEVSSNGLVYSVNNAKTIISYGNAQIDSNIKKVGSNSAKFNGATRYEVNYTNDMSLGTGDFTIESWIYLDTTSSYHRGIVQLGTYTAKKFTIRVNPSKMLEIYYADGNTFLIDDVPITPYVWTHLAVVRNSGVLYLFIDGVLTRSLTFTSSVNTISGRTVIGADTNTGNSYYFLGNIDELSVSNIARYTADFTPRTIPYYDYNTIIYFGGDSLSATPPLSNLVLISSTDFQSGTASYEFNGTNYITVPSNSKYAFGTDDFTIELFAKPYNNSLTDSANLVDNRPQDTNGIYWSLFVKPTGEIAVYVNGSYVITGTTNQLNKWCHIALVRVSGVISLYVNGIKEGQTSTVYNFTRDSFFIGRSAYYPNTAVVPLYKGLIDDLRITKGLARYTENFTPSTTLDTGTRPVKVAQHQGTIIQSELSYSDYLVSYGTQIDPWVAVQPSITVSGEPFTLIDSVITSSNTFTSTETLNVGDIISSDKETFGTIIFKELDEYMVDSDIFFDGVTDKVFTTTDVNIINFVQDKRSNLYTNGLRDALLSAVSSTIYGHINDEIIVDAGEGGSFVLGTMYTSGGYNDTDTTSKFSISTSNDGVDYTVVYENQENLMTNHSHSMTGTGRFIKITFLNEIGDWGRIITNIVGGKWWDLHIVHPMSKVYKYSVVLEVNGKPIVPDYIQWFDNMTINKIVCGKVFINPTTVLNINTENISKVELDLWQEVKGVL